MQNAITKPQLNAVSKSQNTKTKFTGLHFKAHSFARLKEMWEAGEIDRNDILSDINNARSHFEKTATKEYILKAHRLLLAGKAAGAKQAAEDVYALAQFAADLIDRQITPAQIDYAFKVWRLSPNDFMPNQGKILEIIKNAGLKLPSAEYGKRYVQRLRSLIDPHYKTPKQLNHRGMRTPPEKEFVKPPKEERQELIKAMNKKYGGNK